MQTVYLVGGDYHGLQVVVRDNEDEIIVNNCKYRRLCVGEAKTLYFDYVGKDTSNKKDS